jgi:hypothetical protein
MARGRIAVHEARSDEGAVILAIFRKPNVFQKSSGFDRKRPG